MAVSATAQEIPRTSDDTVSIIEWLTAERAIADNARQPFLRIAELAIRFWAGDQYADLIEGADIHWDRRQVRPAGTYGVRKIDNQIVVVARYAVSGVAQSLPAMQVAPVGTDPDAKLSALFATQVLRAIQHKTKERQLREQEILWMVGAEECLRRSGFDPNSGGDPENPHGDILTEVVNPFGYMIDPYSVGVWPPRYVIEEDARHVDWIQEKYGKKVEPQAITSAAIHQLNKIATAVISNQTRSARPDLRDSALVTRLTVPRSGKHPRGRTWIFTGETLLDEHELQAGRFPYSMANWNPLPGRLKAMSLVEMVLSGQMELNHLVSLLYEAAISAVRGDIITRGMDSDIRIQEYDDRTGARQIILGPGVEQFERVNLPADHVQAEVRRQVLERGIKEKAGASEPTLGQIAEGQPKTKYEISQVVGANVQGLAWYIERYSDFHLTAVALQEVKMLQEFVTIPRLEQFRGENGMDPEEVLFSGADLEGADEVIAVPMPYVSPEMRQQQEFQAWQAAQLGEWETLEQQWKFRKMLLRLGLHQMEAEIAAVYGPMEQLEEQLQQMNQLKVEAEAAGLQTVIAAAGAASEEADAQAEASAEGTNVEPAAG